MMNSKYGINMNADANAEATEISEAIEGTLKDSVAALREVMNSSESTGEQRSQAVAVFLSLLQVLAQMQS